ncbi:MAG: universal stress protein [Vicinamibacterales bacterium]
MTGFERLVVALGAPDGDATLIPYAAMLARLGGAREVRFVHVAKGTIDAPALRDAIRTSVDQGTQGLHARIGCDVLHGAVTDRLLEYVTEFQADLVLIGSHRHRLGARLGMVAPCSVAVIPEGHPAILSHLMVALDFSDDAGWALEWATRLAAAKPGTKVTALHVMTPESTDLFPGDEEQMQRDAVQRILEAADCHGLDVTPRLAFVSRSTDVSRNHLLSLAASIQGADVAHTILAEARACGADCLAISTRGRSRSASILLGSVAEQVIERATLPLLVGKHHKRNLSLASILLGHAGAGSGIKTN